MQKIQKINTDLRDTLLILVLSVIVIYFIPHPLNYLISLLILPFIWNSKRDYFWIAVFFIIEDQPGGLFWGSSLDSTTSMPIFTLIPSISFNLRELVYLLLVAKIFFHQNYAKIRVNNHFHRSFEVLSFLFIILIFVSIAEGMSFASVKYLARIIVNLTIFFILFFVLIDIETIISFLKILFPFVLIALGLQIFSLIFKFQLINLLRPEIISTQGVFNTLGSGNELERPLELEYVKYICFVGSLYLLSFKIQHINRFYLILINVVSFFSQFIGATRTWIIAFAVTYFLFFLVNAKNNLKIIGAFAIIIVLFFIGSNQINLINTQVFNSWERVSSIESLAKGDLSAGGTLIRFEVRAPKVMEGFEKSTILFGAGFSDLHWDYYDYHVGFHNILLNVGIFGYLLFIIVIISFAKKTIFSNLVKKNPQLYVAGISLITLLITNTSIQVIGFNLVTETSFFLMAFMFVLANVTLNDIQNRQ